MSLASQPSLAWLQGKGTWAGLGWLAGWAWGGSQRKDRFNKEEERERARAMPLTADLIAYLNADVSRLTYLWKR